MTSIIVPDTVFYYVEIASDWQYLPFLNGGFQPARYCFARRGDHAVIEATSVRDTFQHLIQEIAQFIGVQPLDAVLQTRLNKRYPAGGSVVGEIRTICDQAIAEGWMCEREAGGIRYGRVIKPAVEYAGFSVDVVSMSDVCGPHHRHPNGEIDLIMPTTSSAKFDGRSAGWLVYEPGSAHSPTVTDGTALVLYLLPQGAIEFSR